MRDSQEHENQAHSSSCSSRPHRVRGTASVRRTPCVELPLRARTASSVPLALNRPPGSRQVMGLSDGTAFIDVTDSAAPVVLGKIDTHTGPSTLSRVQILPALRT